MKLRSELNTNQPKHVPAKADEGEFAYILEDSEINLKDMDELNGYLCGP